MVLTTSEFTKWFITEFHFSIPKIYPAVQISQLSILDYATTNEIRVFHGASPDLAEETLTNISNLLEKSSVRSYKTTHHIKSKRKKFWFRKTIVFVSILLCDSIMNHLNRNRFAWASFQSRAILCWMISRRNIQKCVLRLKWNLKTADVVSGSFIKLSL